MAVAAAARWLQARAGAWQRRGGGGAPQPALLALLLWVQLVERWCLGRAGAVQLLLLLLLVLLVLLTQLLLLLLLLLPPALSPPLRTRLGQRLQLPASGLAALHRRRRQQRYLQGWQWVDFSHRSLPGHWLCLLCRAMRRSRFSASRLSRTVPAPAARITFGIGPCDAREPVLLPGEDLLPPGLCRSLHDGAA
jgi:hypothetical protein